MRDTEITSRRVWTRTARGTGQQARFPRIAPRRVYRIGSTYGISMGISTAPGIGTLIMELDFDASFSLTRRI